MAYGLFNSLGVVKTPGRLHASFVLVCSNRKPRLSLFNRQMLASPAMITLTDVFVGWDSPELMRVCGASNLAAKRWN